MRKISYLLTLITFLLMISCASDDSMLESTINDVDIQSSGILSFESKEDFQSSLKIFEPTIDDVSLKVKSATSFISAEDIYQKENDNNEYISFLVPDEKYRHFLNKDLEIIVNDTIYKITKDGTFFSHVKDKKELLNSIEKYSEFISLSENLKTLGNVKIINTFGLWNSNNRSPITNDDYFEDDENDVSIDNFIFANTKSANDGGISKNDIEGFPTIGTVDVSIKDKVLHFSPNYLGDTKLKFRNVKNRKLYVSLYRNDYGFGVSIGLDCKVMKKLWHGLKWGRMVNWDAGIYYGLTSLVVSQEVKTPEFENFLTKHRREMVQQAWNNSINRDNIFDAANSSNGILFSQWKPSFNLDFPKKPFILPYIGNLADYFDRENIAHKIEDFLIKQGAKFLQSSINNIKKGAVQVTFISDRNRTIYHFFHNDLSWNGGGYRVKDTFLKYYRDFTVNISVSGDKLSPTDIIKGTKPNLSENDFIGSPKIIFCQAIVYTRDGNDWIGAKIVKEN